MNRLDLIIFGATGFTGKYVVSEMVRMAEDFPGIMWGVAGRCKNKLEILMASVANKTGSDLSRVKIIVADVSDEDSLKAMCRQAKVLVNCCGPYRFLGEPVVKAAVESITHYVDVSGEPQFIESMQLKYDKQARDVGVYVINACGFDSIPADLGVVFMQQNFIGTLNSVQAYLTVKLSNPALWFEVLRGGGIHYGTWESLVYGIAHKNELPPLRKMLYPDRLPPLNPKLQQRLVHRRNGQWALPLLTSDESVVYRTHRYLYDSEQARPVQFKMYVQMGLLSSLLTMLVALLVYAMTTFDFTRRLLLDYPRVFSMGMVSHDGPSEAVMESTQFQFELVAEGWSGVHDVKDVENTPTNKRIVAKVCGTNPGYGATVVALLMSAITILKGSTFMPPTCGVITPAVAFRNTTIMDNLNKRKLTFHIESVLSI